jgi:hypothetical protein
MLIMHILFFRNYRSYGDWGLGIGDLGIGDWAQSPIPNPQSPIPNPHQIKNISNKNINIKKYL